MGWSREGFWAGHLVQNSELGRVYSLWGMRAGQGYWSRLSQSRERGRFNGQRLSGKRKNKKKEMDSTAVYNLGHLRSGNEGSKVSSMIPSFQMLKGPPKSAWYAPNLWGTGNVCPTYGQESWKCSNTVPLVTCLWKLCVHSCVPKCLWICSVCLRYGDQGVAAVMSGWSLSRERRVVSGNKTWMRSIALK